MGNAGDVLDQPSRRARSGASATVARCGSVVASLIDPTTGAERPLTSLSTDFGLRDFEISPDGRHMVLEQVQELSDIILIELARR